MAFLPDDTLKGGDIMFATLLALTAAEAVKIIGATAAVVAATGTAIATVVAAEKKKEDDDDD